MSKATKIGLITATILVVIGAIIFTGVITMFNFDFSKLDTNNYETNTYNITEAFDNISIDVSVSEIKFLPADTEQCKIVCYEPAKQKHSATVQNSTLNISVNDTRKWYEHISISVASPKLTVYLPQDKYTSLTINNTTGSVTIPQNFTFDDMKIKGSTGNFDCLASCSNLIDINLSTGRIKLNNLKANNMTIACTTGSVNINSVNADGDIRIKTSTGAIKLSDINCANLTAKCTTGSTVLSNTIASENFAINSTTGSVKFESCDAENINIKTTTGSVSGTLRSDKIFITETTTGSVKVPKTTTGGICEVKTTTGSVKLAIQ